MAAPIKAILLEKTDKLGTGLTALKTYENRAIDISDFADAMSDSTSGSASQSYIIKNNRAYTIIRVFMDLDNKVRWVIAKNEENSADRWPTV